MTVHTSVFPKEVIEFLSPKPGQHFIDGTLGGGGHAIDILEHTGPDGKLMAFDQDEDAIERFKDLIRGSHPNSIQRIVLINDNFRNLQTHYASRFSIPVSGVILDLGLSSDQLEVSNRGFTFQKDESLDMRFNTTDEITASDIVNTWPEKEIARILYLYAEEDRAQQIAKAIVSHRKKEPIATTFELIEIINQSNNQSNNSPHANSAARRSLAGKNKIHPATKTFQALRMAVNEELESLKEVLPQALEIVETGGRIAVIAFHGLEDKIVKDFFRNAEATSQGVRITKKPIAPSPDEVRANPRSRSAKLRVFEKK